MHLTLVMRMHRNSCGSAVLLLAGIFDWQSGFPSGVRLHFRAGAGPGPEVDMPLEGTARTLCLLATLDGRIFAGGAPHQSSGGLVAASACQ